MESSVVIRSWYSFQLENFVPTLIIFGSSLVRNSYLYTLGPLVKHKKCPSASLRFRLLHYSNQQTLPYWKALWQFAMIDCHDICTCAFQLSFPPIAPWFFRPINLTIDSIDHGYYIFWWSDITYNFQHMFCFPSYNLHIFNSNIEDYHTQNIFKYGWQIKLYLPKGMNSYWIKSILWWWFLSKKLKKITRLLTVYHTHSFSLNP